MADPRFFPSSTNRDPSSVHKNEAKVVPLLPLDLIVIFVLILFVVLVAFMVSPINNLIRQSERTLDATEGLIRTLDKELGPTLNEVNLVLASVQEIKAIAEQRLTDVGTKVEDVTGTITKAADQAKTQTSVLGAGIVAAFKAYVEGKDPSEHSRSDRPAEKKIGSSKVS